MYCTLHIMAVRAFADRSTVHIPSKPFRLADPSCVTATARVFSMKIGVLPDRVLMSLINDRMIAKGTILDFITAFFKDYLATDSMDDLVQLLRKARLDDRLLDFFPPQKRNLNDFDAHFKVMLIQSLQFSTVTHQQLSFLHAQHLFM